MIRRVVPIFLVLSVAVQPLPARERQQRPKELNAAINRGMEALLRFLPELMKGNGGPDELGRLTLCMTALFKSGLPTDHEVVAPALEQMKSFAHGRTYSAACYLFALDAYWQAKRREWLEKNPEERAESRDTGARVRAAVDTLPLKHREILCLRHFEDLSYLEISEHLGIPEGTVMSRLYYARNRLAERLGDLLESCTECGH